MGTHLDICLGLVGDLHDKFSTGVNHVLKNLVINTNQN